MSAATTPATQPRTPRVKRLWIPAAAVLLAGAGIGYLQLLTGEGFDGRNFMSIGVAALGILVVTLWVVFLSGLALSYRLGYLLLLVALLVSFYPDFSGDMTPNFIFRWTDWREQNLKAQRAAAGKVKPLAALPELKPTDAPSFRGMNRDGVIVGPALNTDWKANPPKLLWKQPVGGGYAAFVGVGPLLITIEQRGPREAVVCYDPDTGAERWAYEHDASFKEALGGPGPRATPTIDGDAVFSLGATGHFACLDLLTGKPRWTKDILAGNENIQWGMSGSPLVVGDLVIVNPGAQTEAAKGKALVAFDRKTGEQKWAAGTTKAGYSSPQLAELAGVKQVLMFDGEGLGGYDAAQGTRLWWFPFPTYQQINVAQPIVLEGDRLYISAGYGVGGAMLQIAKAGDKWEVKELWKNKNLKCKFTSPVLHEGHLYGLDDGILVCLDAKTGERKWKGGRYGHGQILATNDLLFVQCEDGHMALASATPKGFEEKAKVKVFENPKNWNTPILIDGRAYLRNHEEMAAYDLRAGAK